VERRKREGKVEGFGLCEKGRDEIQVGLKARLYSPHSEDKAPKLYEAGYYRRHHQSATPLQLPHRAGSAVSYGP